MPYVTEYFVCTVLSLQDEFTSMLLFPTAAGSQVAAQLLIIVFHLAISLWVITESKTLMLSFLNEPQNLDVNCTPGQKQYPLGY